MSVIGDVGTISGCHAELEAIFSEDALRDPSRAVMKFVQDWCEPRISFFNGKLPSRIDLFDNSFDCGTIFLSVCWH